MVSRLDISFPFKRQCQFWFGKEYQPKPNEFLLNSARAGLVLALRAVLPQGGKVGVVSYNCDTVYNAVYQAGCQCVFLDVDKDFRVQVQGDEDKYKDLNAIVVTNLFGIKNDIESIRKIRPDVFIIEDNAHGYRVKIDGDAAVYSINQGKSPALGPGGILVVNNSKYLDKISQSNQVLLCENSFFYQCKIFCLMLIKAILYSPMVYGWFTRSIKKNMKPKSGEPEQIKIFAMPQGVSRIYNAWIHEINNNSIDNKLFMDLIYTNNQNKAIAEYCRQGVEADIHFKHWPMWAANYGYKRGECPNAEQLLREVIMVPNYYKR